MSQMLAVRIDESGTVYQKDGRLIVGDLDVVRRALAAWGGGRQRGRVVVEIYIESREAVDVSGDLNGAFAEG